MEITNIQIRLRNEDKLKGLVDVTFDDCFVVRGCKIIQGNKGYLVSMPSQKQDDGSHRDIAHPINPEMRQVIEDRVLKAYVTELRMQGMQRWVSDRSATPSKEVSEKSSSSKEVSEESSSSKEVSEKSSSGVISGNEQLATKGSSSHSALFIGNPYSRLLDPWPRGNKPGSEIHSSVTAGDSGSTSQSGLAAAAAIESESGNGSSVLPSGMHGIAKIMEQAKNVAYFAESLLILKVTGEASSFVVIRQLDAEEKTFLRMNPHLQQTPELVLTAIAENCYGSAGDED